MLPDDERPLRVALERDLTNLAEAHAHLAPQDLGHVRVADLEAMLLPDGDGDLPRLPDLPVVEQDVLSCLSSRIQLPGLGVGPVSEARQVAGVPAALNHPADQGLGHLEPEGGLGMAQLLHAHGVDQLLDDLVRELPALPGLEA